MKFFPARAGMSAVIALALATAAAAQALSQTQQTPAPPTSPQAAPSGKVIFSRSTDENGDVKTEVGPAAAASPQNAPEPLVEDADRLAVTITTMDLDVHLQSAAHQIAVRARMTVRNDGKAPLARIPLQLSSSLHWEQIRVAGRNTAFPVATLNSDSDHTGQLHEAEVQLAEPLAPGATVQLDGAYAGTIQQSAQRLVTIGTPEDMALHTDWDEIAPQFTGLRGFGNVVWYPVSSVPVILGDGARLFDEMGRHKLRNMQTRFSAQLTVEFPHGTPPTVALINGVPVALHVADAHGLDADLAGIATGSIQSAELGFEEPSIFVAVRKVHAGVNATAWTTPDNEVAHKFWLDAADHVSPFLQQWLGPRPHTTLTLLDLPDPADAPFETGALLATSLAEGPAEKLDGVMAHALTHAYTQTPPRPLPAWLNEGLATFMESAWVEKHRGRDQALGSLEASRSALALAEPSSPGQSAGTPLVAATAPIYYRTKAAYVLWMLRDMAGDEALSTALRTCVAKTDADTPCPIERLLKAPGSSQDLSWFFSDWVAADKGLPDLTIDGVFPKAETSGNFLVAVNVSNAGYAAAEVPVTVRTAMSAVTDRVLVPARGKAVQRILVMAQPTQVQVNDGTVPETQASVHVTDLGQTSSSAAPAGP